MLEAILRSLELSGASALLAGLLGAPFAWLITRSDFAGRRFASNLLSVPYALPPYLLGMAWVVLGNPTVGLLRAWLPAGGSYGFWGMTWVLASVGFAFPFFEMRAGFDRMDPALEEAARMSGAGPLRVFFDVSMPLLWPAWIHGMCIAFLFSLASFGVPAILGMPVRQLVLTTLIYSQLKIGGQAGFAQGLRFAGVLLLLAGAALGISAWLTRLQGSRDAALSGGKSSRASLVRLHFLPRLAASFGVWGFFFVAVVLPWVALGLSALAPVAGNFKISDWTLKNLGSILKMSEFQQALFNSTVLACGVATLICCTGFLLGFYSTRKKSAFATWAIRAMALPFATPGTVLAIGLIAVFSGLASSIPWALMAVAYTLKYSALGARSMALAFSQVDAVLEEAARVSGASTWRLLADIWFPLVKKSFVTCWILSALPIFTELTMSVLLTGPGAATLGTVLFDLQEYADQPSAAAMAWMLLSLAIGAGLLGRGSYESS